MAAMECVILSDVGEPVWNTHENTNLTYLDHRKQYNILSQVRPLVAVAAGCLIGATEYTHDQYENTE